MGERGRGKKSPREAAPVAPEQNKVRLPCNFIAHELNPRGAMLPSVGHLAPKWALACSTANLGPCFRLTAEGRL